MMMDDDGLQLVVDTFSYLKFQLLTEGSSTCLAGNYNILSSCLVPQCLFSPCLLSPEGRIRFYSYR